MLKLMCAISSVPKPRSKPITAPAETNSSESETPVMMSALTTGMLFIVSRGERHFFFMLKKPMAAKVPTTTAMSEARTETSSVISSDWIIILSLKSSLYQLSVKPDQTVRLLESLNEKTISTAIGR